MPKEISAIPYAYKTRSTGGKDAPEEIGTASETFVPTDMSVDITVDKSSGLLIMFSALARADTFKPGLNQSRVDIRAVVGTTVVPPGYIELTPMNALRSSAYSWHWFYPVPAGTHKVTIEFRISLSGDLDYHAEELARSAGYLKGRTLTVIALPA